MKTYYYTLKKETVNGWDTAPQYKVNFKNWKGFVTFCKQIAHIQQTEIRGCESEGYNNQGYYFN